MTLPQLPYAIVDVMLEKILTIAGTFMEIVNCRVHGLDIDVRVSGSPHAVVKQAENFFVRELGGSRLLLPVPHGGSGRKTGGAHNLFLNLLYQDRLQLMSICCNRRCVRTAHPHTSPSSRSQRACVKMCHTTLAPVFVRVIPSMCHAPE